MTWIKIVPPPLADANLLKAYTDLQALYPLEYGQSVQSVTRPDGTSDSIVAAHSLIPEAMWHLMAGLGVLLREELGLMRRQQEMIASVVSAQNSCFY